MNNRLVVISTFLTYSKIILLILVLVEDYPFNTSIRTFYLYEPEIIALFIL